MKKLLLSLCILSVGISLNAQVLGAINVKKKASAPPPASYVKRILIDFGGDGNPDNGFTDTGVKTPNNSADSTGQATDGRWWNNVVDARGPITMLSNAVDTANNLTGVVLSLDKRGSTGWGDDYGVQYAGAVQDVGDYPPSAVRDNMYFAAAAGTCTLTITIPAGYYANLKFWGTRTASPRGLEFKLSTDVTWSTIYRHDNNVTYTNAFFMSNITGTKDINIRVPAGDSFGHISVLDITLFAL